MEEISISGADPTGRSRIAFAHYKGEAEHALLAAGLESSLTSPRTRRVWNALAVAAYAHRVTAFRFDT
jgi:hypothetical protein